MIIHVMVPAAEGMGTPGSSESDSESSIDLTLFNDIVTTH